MWKCTGCDETNPDTFGFCWHCQDDRASDSQVELVPVGGHNPKANKPETADGLDSASTVVGELVGGAFAACVGVGLCRAWGGSLDEGLGAVVFAVGGLIAHAVRART
jgi:hypothetical protein